MDEIRYTLYSKQEHFAILFDKINQNWAIHSADLENDIAVITGFTTPAQAILFAQTRIVSIEKPSTLLT